MSHSIAFILQTLEDAGMVINYPKSILEPCQEVVHLDFLLDLKGGVLKVPSEKLTTCRRELGKILTHKEMSCRKMAAILGQVRSFLTAMPFLRVFTDLMLQFVSHHRNLGWDHVEMVPPNFGQTF